MNRSKIHLVTQEAEGDTHVETIGVSKSFMLGGAEIPAVREVSLRLERGEFLALCGSSGSGKSTLLNLLGCLAHPTEGRVIIGGQDVGQLTDRELSAFRAEKLGFVFQNFNLLPVLSAVENVEYPLFKQDDLTRMERRERALFALSQVGLVDFASRRPSELSGGQRQRVAIARAFVHRPQLIIADEPTANLDKRTAGEVLDLMARLNENTGSTVILATHDPMAMARARRRVEISDGKVA